MVYILASIGRHPTAGVILTVCYISDYTVWYRPERGAIFFAASSSGSRDMMRESLIVSNMAYDKSRAIWDVVLATTDCGDSPTDGLTTDELLTRARVFKKCFGAVVCH